MSDNGHNGKPGINREKVGYKNPPKATRFKPGNNGHGGGRPRGESLTAKIKRALEQPDKKHGTKGDALIAVATRMARKGDFRFFKEIIDRHDGKVADPQGTPNGERVIVNILNGVSMDDL